MDFFQQMMNPYGSEDSVFRGMGYKGVPSNSSLGQYDSNQDWQNARAGFGGLSQLAAALGHYGESLMPMPGFGGGLPPGLGAHLGTAAGSTAGLAGTPGAGMGGFMAGAQQGITSGFPHASMDSARVQRAGQMGPGMDMRALLLRLLRGANNAPASSPPAYPQSYNANLNNGFFMGSGRLDMSNPIFNGYFSQQYPQGMGH